MKPTPILFLSDSPYLSTGLSRITKDLASLTSQLPQFRVGCLGRGGVGTSKLPFATYSFDERDQWGEEHIENVWQDFAGSELGVIMTVWDLSRLDWFSRPRMGGPLQEFLQSGRFKKWAYVPIDHYSIGKKLSGICADTLRGFDRILAYSLFGKKVLEDTLEREVEWIPHGINGDVFKPRDRAAGRMAFGISPEEQLIGCVMANQARKDWPTAFGAAAAIKHVNRKFWFHTDTAVRYWNLYALAQDFKIGNSVIITTQNFSSEELSYMYSACDVTFLPSPEGFGYPIVESLACGVPVIHGDYAGGAELIPENDWLITPTFERVDTQYNCIRPVWDPNLWGQSLEWAVTQYADGTFRDVCTNSVSHLQWKNLWPSAWRKWFLEGITNG